MRRFSISCPPLVHATAMTLVWLFGGEFTIAQEPIPSANARDGFKDVDPNTLVFRRQATRRMIFDRSQSIPLAGLDPRKIIGLDVMHPLVGETIGQTEVSLSRGALKLSTVDGASSRRWVGGFNPFATYELSLRGGQGEGEVGLAFVDSDGEHTLNAMVQFAEGKYRGVRWTVRKQGQLVDEIDFPWPQGAREEGPIQLRVQMLAVGVNLWIETEDQLDLVGYPDFVKHLDLRRKRIAKRFEFCLQSDLSAASSVEVSHVSAALTPGCGQADIRAITNQRGEPLIDGDRLWITMTIRGRALPHPMQGVFSLNPSVFDLRFEGIIVFDMGDGLWRNELASHLFLDEGSGQWRGWTTGFSALGSTSKGEQKAILAVSSDQDPRRGFSVMQARPVGMVGQHEDPHGLFDEQAGKWRLLLSERAGKYRAGMWESDHWDHGYERLAGPVEMDSTGTLIQKIGRKRYVFFGSADRVVYIRSYPDLNPVGELQLHRPPWTKDTGTRIWPNIIPLPPGYPTRYIALMMDRMNYPNMPKPNWTYGAMYLYHAD